MNSSSVKMAPGKNNGEQIHARHQVYTECYIPVHMIQRKHRTANLASSTPALHGLC